MIKKEYKKLLAILEESAKLEKVSLEDILKEAVVFFEELRKTFPTASKDEREEMMQMMTHLHGELQRISKETAQKAGMSEDELSAYAENPSNFSPEQWQMVQGSKKQLYDSARKFSSAMEKEQKETQAPEGEEVKKTAKKPIRKAARRSRKKDWTKT